MDRYGPRRVQAVLLLFAAAGAALFTVSKGFAPLVLGRALIGLGVAAALTGGLKAIVVWFPKDRVATMNGYMVMLGALGALSATSPAGLLLDWSGGWRGLFGILAAVTVASALMIWVVVPEATSAKPPSNKPAPVSLTTIYRDPRFWGLAPLSATCVGALQGLWAAPWLTPFEAVVNVLKQRPQVFVHSGIGGQEFVPAAGGCPRLLNPFVRFLRCNDVYDAPAGKIIRDDVTARTSPGSNIRGYMSGRRSFSWD